jgi:hypothetical protein
MNDLLYGGQLLLDKAEDTIEDAEAILINSYIGQLATDSSQ